MSNQWIKVGALLRGQVRGELFKVGFDFQEQKHLTYSIFRFSRTDEYGQVLRWLQENGLTA